MRIKQKHDAKDCPDYVDHPHAHLLGQIDEVIEETSRLCELVFQDLLADIDPSRGRNGMTARQVLGAAIAYHLWGDSKIACRDLLWVTRRTLEYVRSAKESIEQAFAYEVGPKIWATRCVNFDGRNSGGILTAS